MLAYSDGTDPPPVSPPPEVYVPLSVVSGMPPPVPAPAASRTGSTGFETGAFTPPDSFMLRAAAMPAAVAAATFFAVAFFGAGRFAAAFFGAGRFAAAFFFGAGRFAAAFFFAAGRFALFALRFAAAFRAGAFFFAAFLEDFDDLEDFFEEAFLEDFFFAAIRCLLFIPVGFCVAIWLHGAI